MAVESRLEHLDLIQEAVLILNNSRKVVFGNRAFGMRFGEYRVGQDIVQLIRNPQCLELVTKALQGGEPAEQTIIFGEPVNGTFDVRVGQFSNNSTAESLLLVSLRDINEFLLAEEMRSDFVANVSHELRSPLSTISGFIETLKGAAKDDAEARARFLDLMELEADRMTRLIADLLSLSKVEVNQRVRPTAMVNIVAIATSVQTSLDKQARDQGGAIELTVPEPIPEIPGNHDELIQVVQNLLENALKYSDSDSTVTVSITRQSDIAGMQGPAVAIQVRDQGQGIAPHHLPRLTERFYRVDSHRSRDVGGTGLGLAIVKHIVLHHRGRLKIDSQVGEGSTFSVYLPMQS